jgi:hypothetical protein
MSALTVRERIAEVAAALLPGDVPQARIRECELVLSSLLPHVGRERRQAEVAYKLVLVAKRREFEKANRAVIEAEATPEYARLLEAKGVEEEVKQMVITCRGFLRSVDNEARLAR